MLDISAWYKSQQEIYAKFNAAELAALEEGFVPDPALVDSKGGYIIGLRPHPIVIQRLADLAAAMGTEEGVVAYGPKMLHTTLSDYRVAAGFDPTKDPDRVQIQSLLINIVQEVCGSITSLSVCRYRGAVCTQNAFIQKGMPNISFVDLAQAVVNVGKKHNIELRMPWGAI